MLIDVILKYMLPYSPYSYSGSVERAGSVVIFLKKEKAGDGGVKCVNLGDLKAGSRKESGLEKKLGKGKAILDKEAILDEGAILDVKNEIEEKRNNKDKSEKTGLEELDDETEVKETISEGEPNITYSFREDQFVAEQLYNMPDNMPLLDYAKLWYAETPRPSNFALEEDYRENFAAKDTDVYDERAALTAEEAKDTMVKIQYATLLGAMHDVSLETRRNFDLWIKFNTVFFNLFESMYALTRNIDYSMGY
ncbi:MAG: hypothetical protein AB1668_05510 [Nanoarchaeota archaeon]